MTVKANKSESTLVSVKTSSKLARVLEQVEKHRGEGAIDAGDKVAATFIARENALSRYAAKRSEAPKKKAPVKKAPAKKKVKSSPRVVKAKPSPEHAPAAEQVVSV